ncbi:phosphopentomutase [Capsulimonas corticalis]|uniref:Phosphopentomutase n=1 Tax=Capsulimonas corticalis TaxID=2219043 RepID=A0A402CSF3_9BACT|nr:phosphopentomutase [Capsulimonas corticalis]BDI31101.1 phosphopentomutase [Capsulimonas corticalis]
MNRVILIVLDGCGVGAMPDAARYGADDPQSATLPHVAEAMGKLTLPTLEALGLGNIATIAGVAPLETARGAWGKAAVLSKGKDSVTGHWEMMGVVTKTPAPTYPLGFPPDVIAAFEAAIGRRTIGNVAASGTEILTRLGAEHVRTGYPIVYTSADSVFQIAAHEEVIPIDALYEMCLTARRMLTGPHGVQRVIARPFVGDAQRGWTRTERRRDYPLAPPDHNLLRALQTQGVAAHAIGVVADLFPASLFARRERTQSNPAHLKAILRAIQEGEEPFVFANCEDFDMLYGHRNDPAGFARALAEFDAALIGIWSALKPGDLCLLTADHGNDPTTPSTDHSREYVPLLIFGANVRGGMDLGTRATLGDVAHTVAEWLGVTWDGVGSGAFAL